jgi:ABC-2 type transport system ATP-binding protein
MEAARAVAGVTDVQMTKLDAGKASLKIEAASEVRPAVVRALVQAEVDVLRVDKGQGRLEDIFLKLTHGVPKA